MSDSGAGDRTEPSRAPRGTRRKALAGIAVGVVLVGGVFVSATGSAGATGSSLLRVLGASKHVGGSTAVTKAPAMETPSSKPTATTSPTAAAPSTTPAAAPSSTAAAATVAPKKAPAAAGSVAKAATAVAAPPLTSNGDSITLTAAEQPSQVGALFPGSISNSHHCTASVVDSPAGDLIVTAAHCLSSGSSGDVFVPGYRDGSAPYGVWSITQVLEDPSWTSNRDPDYDVAFAVVAPLNGRSIESVVGSYGMDTDGVTDSTVQITGYPDSSDEPISCTGASSVFSDSQLTVYCTGYADGTSGSGWVEGYDPTSGSGLLVGVIGGYETGGDTDDVSYTALFDSSVAALYQQAESVG